MKLKPLQDWALIQRIEPKEMTAAGIIIPDAAKDKPTEGIVLAIGPGRYKTEKGKEKEKEKKKFVPTVLKQGQRVIYAKYAAREFELDGEEIVLVREDDVLGTVEETQLAERKAFVVTEKHDSPVMIKKKTEVMTVAAAPVQKKKPAEKKTIKKEKQAPKTVEKKKAGTGTTAKKGTPKPLKKVSGQTTAEKKTTTKKVTPKKTVKKSTPVKKVKATEKKGVAKRKPAVKKPLTKGKAKAGR